MQTNVVEVKTVEKHRSVAGGGESRACHREYNRTEHSSFDYAQDDDRQAFSNSLAELESALREESGF